MAQNIIKGIETVIKGLEMIKVELVSQGAQEDVATKVATILAGGTASKPVEVKAEAKTPKSNKVEAVEADTEEVQDDVEVTGDRKAELEAMSYNDIKALVSSLGGKAVGNKAKLIDVILELEGAEADGEDEEDESTQGAEQASEEADTGRGKGNAKKSSTKPAKEEVEEEEEEDDEEESDEDTEEFREFLADLDNDDLADVAEEAGVKVKKVTKKNRDEIIEKLLADTDKLQEALEELGYYDEEEDEEESDEEVEADEEEEEDDEEEDEEEEEDDEEEDEEEEDDEADMAEELGLNDMSVDELADILTEHDLSAKGKKQALIDRIIKAVEDGTIELDDEEEEEEEEKPAPKKGGKGKKNGKK